MHRGARSADGPEPGGEGEQEAGGGEQHGHDVLPEVGRRGGGGITRIHQPVATESVP